MIIMSNGFLMSHHVLIASILNVHCHIGRNRADAPYLIARSSGLLVDARNSNIIALDSYWYNV